jgi:hypothetical protein
MHVFSGANYSSIRRKQGSESLLSGNRILVAVSVIRTGGVLVLHQSGEIILIHIDIAQILLEIFVVDIICARITAALQCPFPLF